MKGRMTFEKAPEVEEIVSGPMQKLLSKHSAQQRTFVKNYILSGDIKAACKAANISSFGAGTLEVHKDIESILVSEGITPRFLIQKMKEILENKTVKMDKNGNMFELRDYPSMIKVISLLFSMFKFSEDKAPLDLFKNINIKD
mgnify:FL=1